MAIDRETTWSSYLDDTINAYLRMLDQRSINKKIYLFVEGTTDSKFYYGILQKPYYVDGKAYNLPISKDDIKDHISDELLIIAKMREDNGRYNKDKGELYEKANCKKAVLRTIEVFYANKQKHKKIECYGFVDYDLGYDNLEPPFPCSTTHMRDLESTLYRCLIPDLYRRYNTIKFKDIKSFVDTVTDALYFAVQQGILQKISFKYQKEYEQKYKREVPKDIINHSKNLTEYSLKDVYEKKDIHTFSFIKHLNNQSQSVNKINEFYERDIKTDFEIEVSNTYESNSKTKIKSRIKGTVKKWINSQESLEEDENKLLDVMFSLSNGHIVSNCIGASAIKDTEGDSAFRGRTVARWAIEMASDYSKRFFMISPLHNFISFVEQAEQAEQTEQTECI